MKCIICTSTTSSDFVLTSSTARVPPIKSQKQDSVSDNTRPGNDRTQILEIKLHSEEEGGERNRHGTETPPPLGRLGLSDRILLLGQKNTAETRGGKKYRIVFFLFRKIRVSVFMVRKG